MIYLIPIEPLKERYSESWYRNIPLFFKDKDAEYIVIDGQTLTDTVETGTFLDINSTIHYKNSQMMKISELFYRKLVRDNDHFFFYDLEFWGLESLRLLSELNKVKIKISGFLHAASYTTEDAFAVAAPYQQYTEIGWISAVDTVFVGSEYHKQAVIERRLKPLAPNDWSALAKKIIVTGNPLFISDYSNRTVKKKKKLIISNRFDWEKRPNLSLDLACILKDRYPDLDIVVTTSRPTFSSNRQWLIDYARSLEKKGIIRILSGLTKEQYHTELAESLIMLTNSIEEHFGYCVAEAMVYGTLPVMPNRCSHPEFLTRFLNLYAGDLLLFNDEDQALHNIITIIDNYDTDPLLDVQRLLRSNIEEYYHSMDKIANYILPPRNGF
jgi:glycosyltransferase involved in cell wall biosynthesis